MGKQSAHLKIVQNQRCYPLKYVTNTFFFNIGCVFFRDKYNYFKNVFFLSKEQGSLLWNHSGLSLTYKTLSVKLQKHESAIPTHLLLMFVALQRSIFPFLLLLSDRLIEFCEKYMKSEISVLIVYHLESS